MNTLWGKIGRLAFWTIALLMGLTIVPVMHNSGAMPTLFLALIVLAIGGWLSGTETIGRERVVKGATLILSLSVISFFFPLTTRKVPGMIHSLDAFMASEKNVAVTNVIFVVLAIAIVMFFFRRKSAEPCNKGGEAIKGSQLLGCLGKMLLALLILIIGSCIFSSLGSLVGSVSDSLGNGPSTEYPASGHGTAYPFKEGRPLGAFLYPGMMHTAPKGRVMYVNVADPRITAEEWPANNPPENHSRWTQMRPGRYSIYSAEPDGKPIEISWWK